MGSGSATGFFYQVRLVHSLLKYFFKFQLWYWIQIYTTKYSNLLLIILNTSLNCLQHIQKRRNFDAKVTCHQPICLLLHAILSGVGVMTGGFPFNATFSFEFLSFGANAVGFPFDTSYFWRQSEAHGSPPVPYFGKTFIYVPPTKTSFKIKFIQIRNNEYQTYLILCRPDTDENCNYM